MTSTLTRCSELKVGDMITEQDTPDGPFYVVTRVEGRYYWYANDADRDIPELNVRQSRNPRAGVLVGR